MVAALFGPWEAQGLNAFIQCLHLLKPSNSAPRPSCIFSSVVQLHIKIATVLERIH